MDAARKFYIDRWFDPKVWEAAPPAATGSPQRYFGAR
jgi:hypothetical protein